MRLRAHVPAGAVSASRTCTMPTSCSPSRTTSRRCPLRRVISRISSAPASASTVLTAVCGRTSEPSVAVSSSSAVTSRSCRSRSSVPAWAEWATSSRRPSGSWLAATSSTGTTPTRRRQAFASALSATSSGRVTAMKARIGRASRIADRSGCAMAHDFGAISPITRCTNVTAISAATNATTSAVTAGRPQAVNTGRSRSCTAGLATAPSPSVQSVMPSWEPASSSDRSRELRSAARAAALRSAASSRR